MKIDKRNGIIATSIIASAAIATAIISVLAGGGGTAPHVDTKLDASDNRVPNYDWRKSYNRTGTICYSQDATDTTSRCFVADAIPYTTDATDVGWPIEKTQVNRMPYNVSASCDGTPFACSTATMDSTTVDPAGGTTASTITMGGGSVDATAFGYANSTALDFRIWAKCPAGTLDASNIGGAGHWTVDGTAMGSAWNLLHATHSAVTQVQGWDSNGSGGVRLRLSGNDCAIWHATATEKASWQNSTIPTTDATGSAVGTAEWPIDNTTGAFWAASGVTKTETLSEYSGTCWSYSSPTIKLTGSAGCECTWYALDLAWSY